MVAGGSDKMRRIERSYFHYLIAKICDAPLWAMIAYLPFIFLKELNASQLQITLTITVKPLVALGAFYLGARMTAGRARLSKHILWSSFFGRLPFLLFPFYQNGWFYLFGFALYSLVDRAIIPPWMELLKAQARAQTHARAVADGALVRFLTPVLLSVGFAAWMDAQQVWQWLFAGAATVSFLGLIPLAVHHEFAIAPVPTDQERSSSSPWKACLSLLVHRRDFTFFQGIFFFGGMGIMMYLPLLPRYCIDFLQMDYKELSLALAVCKGIGFALAGRIWSKLIRQKSLFSLAAAVAFLAALTPLILAITSYGFTTLCIAFLIYGVMQAGSEPIWHLSGPLFSREKNSGLFTSVNVFAVGVRGLFAPALGALIAQPLGLRGALLGCCAVACLGGFWGLLGHYLYARRPSAVAARDS
jgi:hypothetical protein